MYYINKLSNISGNHGNPMGQPFPECIKLPDELLADYLAYNGFVNLTTDGDTVTAVEPNTEAWEAWKATLPPEPDPQPTEPTAEEKLRADVDFLAALQGVAL